MVKNLPKPRKSSDANQERISFRAQCEAPEEAEGEKEEVGEDGLTETGRLLMSQMTEEDWDDYEDLDDPEEDEDEDEEE